MVADKAPLVPQQEHDEENIALAYSPAADVIIVGSRDAQAALLAISHEVVVTRVPSAFLVPPAPPGPNGRKDLLWVASAADQAGLDAMHWFLGTIWPLVLRDAPGTVLRVGGAGTVAALRALDPGPGVQHLGSIDEPAALYDRYRVFVAPFHAPSTGLTEEIGESIVHGLPVVATRIAAAGLELQDGMHLLEAEEPNEFAKQVVRLLYDNTVWLRISTLGRAHVASTFSIDALRESLEGLLSV
jgi:glycosyltransferase involved in cell wall biosynthesis